MSKKGGGPNRPNALNPNNKAFNPANQPNNDRGGAKNPPDKRYNPGGGNGGKKR